jgi:transposase
MLQVERDGNELTMQGTLLTLHTWQSVSVLDNAQVQGCVITPSHAVLQPCTRMGGSQYHRIAARRGANLAVDHSILTVIYNMLKRKSSYFELGPDYLEEKKKQAIIRQTVKKKNLD